MNFDSPLLKKITDEIRTREESVKQAQQLAAHAMRIDQVTRTMHRFMKGNVFVLSNVICVTFKVKSMKDIEPVLATYEEALGIDFDKSEDAASAGWREFRAKDAPWLRIDAELEADGDDCKRVIVGYEQVPVYKFHCGPDAPPDAPAPDSHPF